MQAAAERADERIVTDGACAMLAAPELGDARVEWLVPDHWRARGELRELAGGRGGVAIVETPAGEAVLRHYRRGGMLAALRGDRYRWRGAARTRSFIEFRLLRALTRMDLPVPRALAGGYCRRGLHYTADMLTLRIPGSHTLATCIAAGHFDQDLAAELGAVLARFHRHGVFHADLNAHNVLINAEGVHLIDFDRGELRVPAARWQRANLGRLRRSLLKLGVCGGDAARLDATLWRSLQESWSRAMRR